MRNLKTFNQLFESEVQLRPSRYWSFFVFFPDKRIGASRVARFLVSGDSNKSITTEFLENLLPQYLGFDSLYTLSPDIAPPAIEEFLQFELWIHDNIDEISDRAGSGKIYVHGREITNGLDFPEFLDGFEGEGGVDKYTELYGDPVNIAWLIMNYLKPDIESKLPDIFDLLNQKVGNTVNKNNHFLTISEKYAEIVNMVFDSNGADAIYAYFREKPLELHMVNDPKIKEKILLKTGIKDYSKLGKGLRSGFI